MSLTPFSYVNVAAAKRSAVEMVSSVHSSVVSSTLSSAVQLMSHFYKPTLLTPPSSFLLNMLFGQPTRKTHMTEKLPETTANNVSPRTPIIYALSVFEQWRVIKYCLRIPFSRFYQVNQVTPHYYQIRNQNPHSHSVYRIHPKTLDSLYAKFRSQLNASVGLWL